MKETVNHPAHYNQIVGIECIDVAEQMGFNLGNALKYIWRCGDKGNKVEDIKKAIWYLNREIDRSLKLKSNEQRGEAEYVDASRNVCEHFVPAQLECIKCDRGASCIVPETNHNQAIKCLQNTKA